jgi:hypothetical protein
MKVTADAQGTAWAHTVAIHRETILATFRLR